MDRGFSLGPFLTIETLARILETEKIQAFFTWYLYICNPISRLHAFTLNQTVILNWMMLYKCQNFRSNKRVNLIIIYLSFLLKTTSNNWLISSQFILVCKDRSCQIRHTYSHRTNQILFAVVLRFDQRNTDEGKPFGIPSCMLHWPCSGHMTEIPVIVSKICRCKIRLNEPKYAFWNESVLGPGALFTRLIFGIL